MCCSRILRVTSVGAPDVLKSKPFTDTVPLTAGSPDPEPSMTSMPESVSTVIVVTAGIAPVNRGESPVKVNVPALVSTLPTYQ